MPIIQKKGIPMKSILIISVCAVLLGGCVIAPVERPGYRDGYYQGRDHVRGDAYGRDYYYRRDYDNSRGPFQDHGR